MKNRKNTVILTVSVVLLCALMAFVDGAWKPGYAVKSAIKVIAFLVAPIALSFACGLNIGQLFKANKKGMKIALCLCVPVFAIILGGYFLLRNSFDFSGITGVLAGDVGVNRDNFIYVALYISLVNSLLEEFFFRGFSFLALKEVAFAKYSYIFSALAFAAYHVAIMTGWFSPALFVLALAGLFCGGLIFNYLDDKSGNIYTSYLVHMFANFAINTVGFILFGVI